MEKVYKIGDSKIHGKGLIAIKDLEYENEKIHLPADGHAYIVNAGFMHSFCNGGSTPRYHYCGILSLSNRGDGLKPPQLYD